MNKNKFKIFALDGPWGSSSGNNNRGSGGGFSGGNNDSIDDLLKDLKNRKVVCISAHGNSLRALCKYLFKINEKEISKMEIPTANPLLITFVDNLKISSAKYLDKERAKNLIAF